jgi:hypothetical protein
MFELENTTNVLLDEISNKDSTIESVAKTYRLAFISSCATDWKKVNQAIISRWGIRSLIKIKTLAQKGGL